MRYPSFLTRSRPLEPANDAGERGVRLGADGLEVLVESSEPLQHGGQARQAPLRQGRLLITPRSHAHARLTYTPQLILFMQVFYRFPPP